MKTNFKMTAALILVLFVGIFFGRYWTINDLSMHNTSMVGNHFGMGMINAGSSQQDSYFVAMRDHMVGEMINDELYKCCLEKPCTYCLTESREKDEQRGCDCLEEVMNGEHPCGECIGEILEGKGNHLIAKYFATALSDELGQDHLAEIQKIIEEKYGVAVAAQI